MCLRRHSTCTWVDNNPLTSSLLMKSRGISGHVACALCRSAAFIPLLVLCAFVPHFHLCFAPPIPHYKSVCSHLPLLLRD